MYLEFNCNHCQQRLRIQTQFSGATIRCPHCQTTQTASTNEPGGSTSEQSPAVTTPVSANPYRDAPITSNPFASPTTDAPSDFSRITSKYDLARPATRLCASIVDWLFFLACWLPGGLLTGLLDPVAPRWSDTVGASVLLMGMIGGAILQWYRISRFGQSLGKQLLGIQIVTRDGNPPGFLRGVMLRQWVIAIFAPCYPLAAILYCVDSLMVFSNQRQCLHDLLASTYVVVAKTPPSALAV